MIFKNTYCISYVVWKKIIIIVYYFPSVEHLFLCPNACISCTLCTTALWCLSQASKLSLPIAPCMPVLYKSSLEFILALRRHTHWYIFIYNSIFGLFPSHPFWYILLKTCNHCLRSIVTLLLSVPKVGTELANRPLCSPPLQSGITCRQIAP